MLKKLFSKAVAASSYQIDKGDKEDELILRCKLEEFKKSYREFIPSAFTKIDNDYCVTLTRYKFDRYCQDKQDENGKQLFVDSLIDGDMIRSKLWAKFDEMQSKKNIPSNCR